MSTPSLPTPVESAARPHRASMEIRCAIVALAIVLAGAVDFLLHVIWLPSLMSRLAVQQLRPDDAVAQAVRGVTQWANWSHALLAIFVVVFAIVVLSPTMSWSWHAAGKPSAEVEEA